MRIRQDVGLTFDDVLLVPQKTNIASRKDVDLTTRISKNIRMNIPIVSANMDTVTESKMAIAVAEAGGIGILHRFIPMAAQATKVRAVKKKGLLVGAAIGIKGDYVERTRGLVKAGVDVIVLDIAHGHSIYLIKVLKELKAKYKNTDIIAGNIATYEGALELIKAGADGIKVGIGPGSICITRLVAGAGVPQLTAIMEAVRAAKKFDVPVIADGGIRRSGDIVKALAAGASSVMIGSKFAACEESPSIKFEKEGRMYKLTRGMASAAAYKDKIKHSKGEGNGDDVKSYTAEGVEAIVPYKGPVKDSIDELMGGTRSGFSYTGAKNIEELWKKAEFIQISPHGLTESHPHDVVVT
ncbi:IMP dehydrogenase [Candidatus Woesebacteria bacterium]|nr:IMP dehydrogenase [Candidatus Woesebacteria bacterium]